jgi:hypothetical protein
MLPCALASKLKNWDRHCRSHFRHLGRPLSSFDSDAGIFVKTAPPLPLLLSCELSALRREADIQFSLEPSSRMAESDFKLLKLSMRCELTDHNCFVRRRRAGVQSRIMRAPCSRACLGAKPRYNCPFVVTIACDGAMCLPLGCWANQAPPHPRHTMMLPCRSDAASASPDTPSRVAFAVSLI